MAEPGESLQIRVDEEHRHRDRPEPAHDRIELEDREEKHREGGRAEREHLRAREQAARKLTSRGAWIRGVELGVDEPVQRHRQRARPDHGDRHPEHVAPARASRRPRGRRLRRRTAARKPCARSERARPGGAEAGSAEAGHVCRWGVAAVAGGELEPVARAPGGAPRTRPGTPRVSPGDSRSASRPRSPATPRERSACGVRASASARIASAIPGASRSRTARRRFGSHVTRSEAGPSCCQYEQRSSDASSATASEICSSSSGDDAATTSKPSSSQKLLEHGAARVLALARVHAVRHRQDGRLQTGSFVFSTSRTSPIRIVLVDRLGHVVHGQRGDGRGDERLHLDSRLRRRLRDGLDVDRRLGDCQPNVHVREGERMAERNELGRSLRGHDPRQLRGHERVALRQLADRRRGRRGHVHARPRNRAPPRQRLSAHVDHPHVTRFAHVRKPAHARIVDRSPAAVAHGEPPVPPDPSTGPLRGQDASLRYAFSRENARSTGAARRAPPGKIEREHGSSGLGLELYRRRASAGQARGRSRDRARFPKPCRPRRDRTARTRPPAAPGGTPGPSSTTSSSCAASAALRSRDDPRSRRRVNERVDHERATDLHHAILVRRAPHVLAHARRPDRAPRRRRRARAPRRACGRRARDRRAPARLGAAPRRRARGRGGRRRASSAGPPGPRMVCRNSSRVSSSRSSSASSSRNPPSENSGVRSSCEALATNSFRALSSCASWTRIRSNATASCPISSSPRSTIGAPKSPPAIRSAAVSRRRTRCASMPAAVSPRTSASSEREGGREQQAALDEPDRRQRVRERRTKEHDRFRADAGQRPLRSPRSHRPPGRARPGRFRPRAAPSGPARRPASSVLESRRRRREQAAPLSRRRMRRLAQLVCTA